MAWTHGHVITMKKNYYCIVISKDDTLLLVPIGGCYTEDQALTRANLSMRSGQYKHIVWTLSEDWLTTFKHSVNNIQEPL